MTEKWEHRIYYCTEDNFDVDFVAILSHDPSKYFSGTAHSYLDSRNIKFQEQLFGVGKEKPCKIITSLWLSEGFKLDQIGAIGKTDFLDRLRGQFVFSKKID